MSRASFLHVKSELARCWCSVCDEKHGLAARITHTQSQRAWFQRIDVLCHQASVATQVELSQVELDTHRKRRLGRCTVQCPLRSTMVASVRLALLELFPAAASGAGHSQFLPNHGHLEHRDVVSSGGEGSATAGLRIAMETGTLKTLLLHQLALGCLHGTCERDGWTDVGRSTLS
ncbi:hypothetical protein P171DRAFT_508632 [Karstenula rhodostoma CBS 690.94]|uniref:Uncharacterized protein n=1 Tax=Karstenula rhodostoma CBS 690.94 TaxID=1392251 RepID=A0A9P4PQA5_9PLEO|nr:hypothetical protein P171DRAFT_508632 [Karstenula rhodostoma CBS 690.94]